MVQDIARSSLTQLGDIPQDAPTQSQEQSLNEDPKPPQIEDISSEGKIFDFDQEDPHSGTVLNQLLMAAEEQADDSFSLPVVTGAPLRKFAEQTPLWKFAEQTPSGSQPKSATTQAQPMTNTLVKPAGPQRQLELSHGLQLKLRCGLQHQLSLPGQLQPTSLNLRPLLTQHG